MIKFTDFLSFLTYVAFVLFPQVMQQQTLGQLGIWTAIWWLVMSEMFISKTIKILLFFSKLVPVIF